MKPVKISIKENINLYYNPTKKFKTTTLGVYIHRPLSREECTLNSLLCMVMRRGCPGFEDSKTLSRYLDNLYGAGYATAIRKKADRQILSFNFQFVNDKFLDDNINVLEGILDIADRSILKQTDFNEEYVNQEKENLKKQLLSIINDKRSYATKRCTEIMCQGEVYGISKNGYMEDIDGIDKSKLLEHYKNVVLKSPVDIFVNGDVDIDTVAEKLKTMFADINVEYVMSVPADVKKEVDEVKKVTEEQQIVQGKLSIGFRTNVYVNDE
ncbi:MAG: insulinase family protein, partial [Clostridia bacterium]|nr:insulinase family protein [Clostridia bacterium]